MPPAAAGAAPNRKQRVLNGIFSLIGIESWKPVIAALLLPPLPFLLLLLVGARLLLPRRGWGWLVILLSVAGLWLSASSGFARIVEHALLTVPPALSRDRIDALKLEAKGRSDFAIVILGGGREKFAPEYGVANLEAESLERLRYGLWLSRETGIPVAFSGGTGWGQTAGISEAEIASRIATQEFGRPLKWVEGDSRDTRENAARTVALLKNAQVRSLLLVTHGWHMQRAVRAFQQSADDAIGVEPAPMGLALRDQPGALSWLPSNAGFTRNRQVLREWLGRLSGA